MATDLSAVKILAQKKEGQSILDAILESRGITDKNDFFDPESKELISPYAFSQMDKAVSIINSAIKNKDKILIWGDFDADGVTSTAILYKALKALGADCDYFLPDRISMGHGLYMPELLKQKAKNKLKVLITVDCGISSKTEINTLKALGIKVIITDHHEPPETLPNADCIINPLAKNSLSADLPVKTIQDISYISGSGVAYKLACALLPDNHPLINELTAISAIGIIADVVPLLGESRVIVAKGLKEINKGVSLGVSRLFESQSFKKEITSTDIAFILAPRINAAGRLDNPFESIKLFLEENIELLDMTIEKLNMLNKIRQQLCETVTNDAIGMIQTVGDVIVLHNPNWHIGIIGIVASKLVELYKVPVFMMTTDSNNMFRCSIRSTENYDIATILTEMQDYFTGFGGHAMAGGFSADSTIISFEKLKELIEATISDNKDETRVLPLYTADISLNGEDLTLELLDDIKKLEPFGQDNPRPTFLFEDATLLSKKVIGKDESHLSFSIEKDSFGFQCLMWNRSILGIQTGDEFSFLFRPEINVFQNQTSIRLMTHAIIGDSLMQEHNTTLTFFDHRQKIGILDKVDGYINSKNGDIKAYAHCISTKNELEKYKHIKENLMSLPFERQKVVMMFDYPTSSDEFKDFISHVSPECIHIMRSDFSKNPDDYISTICGMIKYATKHKDGQIDVKTIADSVGLDEIATQTALELLEKIESISITDDGKIYYLNPPKQAIMHTDSIFEIFKDEFDRVINYKTFFKTASIEEIEQLVK